MIAFDAGEELCPAALDPVAADGTKDVGHLGGHIFIEERIRKVSHPEPRMIDMAPDDGAGFCDRGGVDQLMFARTQPAKGLSCFAFLDRLGEESTLADEQLIRTQDQRL